jgi:ABC-type branched-subunit amino acid transport system ATPase component
VAEPAPARAPALAVRGITVRFGGVTAVSGVSLAVAPGEVVGLIGPNGAGKTTLLDAISGFAPVASVDVDVGGRSMTTALPYLRARAGLARSFQDARLFPSMTVRETLLSGLHPAFVHGVVAEALSLGPARREERELAAAAERLLELVDLGPYLDRRVADLSFGTTRALELAWLAARRPSVLLLDEPASGLQQSEVRALPAVLRRIRGDAAAIVVDHDVAFVREVADRLIAMDLGRLVAEGSADEVLGHPDVVASYLGRGRYAGARR